MLFVKVKGGKVLKVVNYNVSDGVSKVTTSNGEVYVIGIDAELILDNNPAFLYNKDYYFYDRTYNKVFKGKYLYSYEGQSIFQSENDEHYVRASDVKEHLEEIYPSFLEKHEDRESFNYANVNYNTIKLQAKVFGYFDGRIQQLKIFVKYNESEKALGLFKEDKNLCFVKKENFFMLENNPKDFLKIENTI